MPVNLGSCWLIAVDTGSVQNGAEMKPSVLGCCSEKSITNKGAWLSEPHVQRNAALNAHGVGPASQDNPAVAIPPHIITHNVYYVKSCITCGSPLGYHATNCACAYRRLGLA